MELVELEELVLGEVGISVSVTALFLCHFTSASVSPDSYFVLTSGVSEVGAFGGVGAFGSSTSICPQCS